MHGYLSNLPGNPQISRDVPIICVLYSNCLRKLNKVCLNRFESFLCACPLHVHELSVSTPGNRQNHAEGFSDFRRGEGKISLTSFCDISSSSLGSLWTICRDYWVNQRSFFAARIRHFWNFRGHPWSDEGGEGGSHHRCYAQPLLKPMSWRIAVALSKADWFSATSCENNLKNHQKNNLFHSFYCFFRMNSNGFKRLSTRNSKIVSILILR